MVLPVKQISNDGQGGTEELWLEGSERLSGTGGGRSAADAARPETNEGQPVAGKSRSIGEQPCICLFSALYAPSTGGVEGYTRHLAHALARMGWRVIVVAMNTHGREGYVHEADSDSREQTDDARQPQVSGAKSLQQEGNREPQVKDSPEDIACDTPRPVAHDSIAEPPTGTQHVSVRPTPRAAGAAQPLVEVVRLPCKPLLGGRYPVPRKNAEFRALWRWLESQRINYVVVNTRFYLLSQMGMELAQSKGIQPVVIEHGSAHLTMGSPLLDCAVQAVEHSLTRKVASYPASFYGVSQRACAWLHHFGITASGVLPNAIDADEFATLARTCPRNFRQELGLPDDAVVLAFIGRLVPEKGIMPLVEAVQHLKTDRPVALLVAGDGPLAQQLAQRPPTPLAPSRQGALQENAQWAQQKGPQDGPKAHGSISAELGGTPSPEGPSDASRIVLLGALERRQVAALLAQADLLCLPSRSEGFATVLLEAAAVGTPALATPVGGTDELIPSPEFGIVIPDNRPETIAKALEKALSQPEALAAVGRNAAKRVREHFSWRATASVLAGAGQGDA